MIKHYQMTILEEFVEKLYSRFKITEPKQITVRELSKRLNVWVHYEEVTSRALEAVSGMYSMFLDSRLPVEQQRIDFLHELCHLLRHAGNQFLMPESFTRMQELEAEQFVTYAAMPISMISRLVIPTDHYQAKCLLMEEFKVSSHLAEKRISQIHRRINQSMMTATLKDRGDNQNYQLPCWSPETKRILKQLDRQLIARGLPRYEDKGLI
ncbi:ImmA/IrrE family metallo-endopeptidase [Fontibacillus sp. BL9]|uniref:ImmA/IrrE family metallo-endopeptidase n=1 Tax=Fontibacillus sp. BL9 TaxID=3389971 RepID=UPI00397CA543